MLWNEDQLPRVKKERRPTLRGQWESVISGKHMDNAPKETHVVSVITHKPLETGEGQRQGPETKRAIVFSRIPFEVKTD